jgi:hypothetical protein
VLSANFFLRDFLICQRQICTLTFGRSQNCTLTKRSRKHENQDKQRDRESIERFDCNGVLKILLNMETHIVTTDLKHNLLHK